MRRKYSLYVAIALLILCGGSSAAFADWSAGGNPISTASGEQRYPSVISDGEGGSILVWKNWLDDGIYAQRIDADGAALWNSNGVAICVNDAAFMSIPEIAPDGSGGVIVTWTAAIVGGYALYAQRLDHENGSKQWVGDGGGGQVVICSLAGAVIIEPRIVPDEASGAIIAWADTRNDPNRNAYADIFAQKVNSNGVPQWTTNGVEIYDSGEDQPGPELVTDGSGGAIVTWRMTYDNDYIRTGKITSGGSVQWAGFVSGTSYLAPVMYDICSDGAGGVISAYAYSSAQEPLNSMIYVMRRDASGNTPSGWWPGGIKVCSYEYSSIQGSPKLVPDGSGGAIISWLDKRNEGSYPDEDAWDIYAQRISNSGEALWAENGIALCMHTTTNIVLENVTMSPDNDNGAIVVWSDRRNGPDNVFAQWISSSGAIFWPSNGIQVCNSSSYQYEPTIAYVSSEAAIIGWVDSRGGDADLYANTVSLPTPAVINPGGGELWAIGTDQVITWEFEGGFAPLEHFEIGYYSGSTYETIEANVNRNDRQYTWHVDALPSAECRICVSAHFGEQYSASYSTSGLSEGTVAIYQQETQWDPDGEPVNLTGSPKGSLQMVSDGSGGTIHVWTDWRNGYGEIYAQKVDQFGAGQWTPADGVPILSGTEEPQTLDPVVISDGASGAIIAWCDYRSTTMDIYAQRISAAGSVMWTTNGVLVAENSGFEDRYPQITSDKTGGAIIAWEAGSRILAQRINSSGARLWSDFGQFVSTVGDNASYFHPVIMSDGYGGAYIAWARSQNGSSNVYVQRVNSNGGAYFYVGGVVLSTHANNDYYPMLVSDGKEGAIVAWVNEREPYTIYYDVYAQRITSNAVLKWPSGGILVASDIRYAEGHHPRTVSDGMGGAIVAWENLTGDIYAQRINDAGALQWGSGGRAVCNTIHEQANPSIVKVSPGRTMVAWTDSRGLDADIYVQELDSHGDPLWSVNGKPVCTATKGQGPVLIIEGAIIGWFDRRIESGQAIYAQKVEPDPLPAQPVPPCTVTYEFFRSDNGQLVDRDMMNGCPFGDFEFLRATLEFNVADLLRDIASSEITLVKPTNVIIFWSMGAIHADSSVVLAHAVNGKVKTTITHNDFSHNYNVNYRTLLSVDVGINFDGAPLGSIVELIVKSPDYTADGCVNSGDMYYFNLTYGKSMGNPAYNPWFDFTYDNKVDAADKPHMLLHKNQHLPDPMQQSSPAGTTIGVKVVTRESEENQGKFELAVYLEDASDVTTACIGLKYDAAKYEMLAVTPSSQPKTEAAFLVSPVSSDGNDLLFITADIRPDRIGEIELGIIELALKSEGDGAIGAPEFAVEFADVRHSDGTVVQIGAATCDMEERTPAANNLADAYPNPFNPVTTIKYSIANDTPVNLSIYNVNGQLVRTLVNEIQRSNEYSVLWDGRDNQGVAVQSGVYFYRIKTNSFAKSKKFVLLR